MRGVLSASLLLGCAAGCAPTPQANGEAAQPAPAGGSGGWHADSWAPVADAVRLGLRSLVYKEKISVQVSVGSIQSGFSVYGSVNAPDRASIGLHVNSDNLNYYQQGRSAYAQENLRWGQVSALRDVDVFPSYARLVERSAGARVPILRSNEDQFVIDEYCAVYQARVPARLVPRFADWGTVNPRDMSDVVYTFYIGRKDGQLREVTTDSVGQLQDVGAMEVHTDTQLFDLGREEALVTIPKSLFGSLLAIGN